MGYEAWIFFYNFIVFGPGMGGELSSIISNWNQELDDKVGSQRW